jgi:hypothetical protein
MFKIGLLYNLFQELLCRTVQEDWNYWVRCFKAGARFRYLPLTVYHHTSRPDSMLRELDKDSAFYRKLATEGVF